MTSRTIVAAIICLSFPSVALAQDERGWVDVNFGIAHAAEDSYTTVRRTTLFRETGTFEAEYFQPTGAEFDFGGGYLFTPVVGLGVSFTGTAHSGAPTLTIRIPSPTFFNTFASATEGGATELGRAEGGVNIQAMINATPRAGRVRVRFFGGPTFFRVKADTIDNIRYNQVYLVFSPVNSVDITNYEFSEAEGTGWGFHVGGDVSVFFSRVVGVGGFVRVSRGTVELTDFSGAYDVKAGGFQAGGGLRLKF
jgi:hypothetical protein